MSEADTRRRSAIDNPKNAGAWLAIDPSFGILKLYHSQAACSGDRFRTTKNVQFVEYTAEMRLHRRFAYGKAYTDFLIAPAERQQCQDLLFSARQGFAAHRRRKFCD